MYPSKVIKSGLPKTRLKLLIDPKIEIDIPPI